MIYGIFSGEYSDWDAHGYFENKEEASEYCKARDDYYYIPMLNLADGADPEVKRAYTYYFETGIVKRAEYCDDFDHPRTKINRSWRMGEPVSATVYVRPGEEYKIQKIAQDALAKWRAKEEGIV